MLSAVFSLKLSGISSDHVLKNLICSFEVERHCGPVAHPSWDLDVVLRHLSSSANEPLESQSLRTLTKKILFFISLATAKRISELQALSRVVPLSGDDLILSFLPFFVAKTESPSNSLPRYFRLRSLRNFAHGLEEGSHLCPVRALSIYLQRTKGLAGRSSSICFAPLPFMGYL